MTEDKHNALSALLDGELPARTEKQLARELAQDTELREVLCRYRMIGDNLKGEPVNLDAMGLMAAVSRRLDAEPTVLAPVPRTRTRRWLQPVAGTALAASVAALGIAFAPQLLNQNAPEQNSGIQVVANPIVNPTLVSHKETRWKTLRPEMESNLNQYLEDHNGYAVQGGVQGVMPYASFVSYDGR